MSQEGPTHRLAFITAEGNLGHQDVTRPDIGSFDDAEHARDALAESLKRPGLRVFAWSEFKRTGGTP